MEEDEGSFQLESTQNSSKGWISKRSKSVNLLSIVPPEEGPPVFNLSDSGSFRDGLLHISAQGCSVAAPTDHPPMSVSPYPTYTPESSRSTTSVKRANKSEEVRFELNHADFHLMEVIGKGSCGYVRKAFRKSSNEMFALKVINVFEVEKRKQMMQEVLLMCDAKCDSLIRFYGAFYNEGAISVVLEYMTAGSVADVLKLAHRIPEPVLCVMTEQILHGMAWMHAHKQARVLNGVDDAQKTCNGSCGASRATASAARTRKTSENVQGGGGKKVHRDFKPCNLLVDHSGRVKITGPRVSSLPWDEYTKRVPAEREGLTMKFRNRLWSVGGAGQLRGQMHHFRRSPPSS